MRDKTTFNETLEKEIENRINIMEKDSYKGVPAINKADVIGMVIIAGVCIVGLIWGVL